MRRFFKTVSIMLLCGMLSCPVIEARGRNNNGGGQHSTTNTQTPSRPGGNQSNNRPGNNNNNGNNRPGNNNQGNNRPNNNNNGNNRPGNNNQGPNRPGGNNPGPGNHGNNNYRPNNPGPGHSPNHYQSPAPRPWQRPVPPPSFRPYHGVPVISTILGVALGTAINASLNALLNNGYNVTAYGNDAIYLSNAYQLNMLWPNATMYYNNGFLTGSEFVYNTPYFDINRYNMTYNALVRNYGMPVTSQALYGGGMEATWFGYNGQFVRLQYLPEMTPTGMMHYSTVLSFGN